jgi:hypothetical protein
MVAVVFLWSRQLIGNDLLFQSAKGVTANPHNPGSYVDAFFVGCLHIDN